MFFSSQIILCLTLTKPEDVSLCKEEANLWWDELLYVKNQYPKGSRYWVEGLTCAKDHLLVPKVVCPMATAYPYAST